MTHCVNAFESGDGGTLHLDAVVTDSPALLSHFNLTTGGRQLAGSGHVKYCASCMCPSSLQP
jgi:hypothetical protein